MMSDEQDLVAALKRELRGSNPHKDVDGIVAELTRLDAAPSGVKKPVTGAKRKAVRAASDIETR